MGFVAKIFGSKNERELKRLWPLVQQINALEPSVKQKSDVELKRQTIVFKERLANGETLDALLPEAFATVREASVRVLGMRHFDVQLLGGIILHNGTIAEMRTGEGKTLCATLPVYLNALSGKGVHLVTVNDYLARRDAAWMGKIYSYLGLSTGVVVHNMEFEEKKAAYQADITYGQNNEFGFDYLRDNMKIEIEDMVQRGHNYAIVDEVDSILIDEARTPLIISGAVDQTTDRYKEADKIVQKLKDEEDYSVELKTKNVTLTEDGVKRIEKILGIDNLYDPTNIALVHHLNQALKARVVMKRDFDYVVRDDQVIIVDEFTGRLMAGRRWSDGLHQAVEAKESVTIQRESQTLATITFQNYFRMYKKLAGMTGTADTEAVELKKIYNLDVAVVPTNRPMLREDRPDVIYPKERGKFNAVCDEIEDCVKRGQPVLVGTASIARSELLSEILSKRGVKHHVLNAKQHEREAEIVAQAGRLGAVTISTNMAGRGTDILLGGNPEFLAIAECGTNDETDPEYIAALKKYSAICSEEKEKVKAAGGLHILGTERHESRRIDNQLRGRSGRQGDPGSSQFYVSLEDDLMKRFGGERLQAIMARVGMTEDDAIGGKMVASSIERAQKRVEGYNFEVRKHLIDYDDVMTKQRNVVYGLREKIMRGEGLEELLKDITEDVIEDLILLRANEKEPVEKWDVEGIVTEYKRLFNIDFTNSGLIEKQQSASPEFAQELFNNFKESAADRLSRRKVHFGEDRLLKLSRVVYLQALDYYWKEHLSNMDSLKEGIGLRGYGQKNPLHEYQQESFELFAAMMMTVKSVVVQNIFVPDLPSDAEIKALENREREAQRAQEAAARTVHEEADSVVADNSQPDTSGLNRAQRRRVSAQNPSSAAVNAPEDAPTQAALLAHFREQRVKGKKKK